MAKGDIPKNNETSDEDELRKTQQDIMRLKKKLEAQRKATELKQQELQQRSSGKSSDFAQNEYSSDFYDAATSKPASPRVRKEPEPAADKSSKKFISADNAWESAMADTPDFSDDDLLFEGKGNAQTRPGSVDYGNPPTEAGEAKKPAPKANPAASGKSSGKFKIPLQDSEPATRRAVFESRPMAAAGERAPTDSRSNLRARPDLKRGNRLATVFKLSAYAGGALLVLAVLSFAGIYLGWHEKLPVSAEVKLKLDQTRAAVFGKSATTALPPRAAKPEKTEPRRTLRTRPIPQE